MSSGYDVTAIGGGSAGTEQLRSAAWVRGGPLLNRR
jgi:hypothetical protein